MNVSTVYPVELLRTSERCHWSFTRSCGAVLRSKSNIFRRNAKHIRATAVTADVLPSEIGALTCGAWCDAKKGDFFLRKLDLEPHMSPASGDTSFSTTIH